MTKETSSVAWNFELLFPSGSNATRNAVTSYLERNNATPITNDLWRLKGKLRAIEKHARRIEDIMRKADAGRGGRVRITSHLERGCTFGVEDFIVRFQRTIEGA